MNSDQDPRSEKDDVKAARKASLQTFADTLAAVILASRMMHGVTVALSVRSEDEDEVIMASNTSTVGRDQNDQAAYAVLHMRHIEKGAAEAINQIEQAAGEALERRQPGKVN